MIPATNTPTTSTVEPIKVVRDIIKNQMGLKDSQIVLSYQDYRIPSDGLFVVVGYLGPTEAIANQAYFDPTLNQEVQEVTVRHTIQIDIMSMAPDNSARIRKEEIMLALQSFYSQNQQAKNLLGIAWLQSDLVDATAIEGTTMLNRYVTTCSVNALHRKTAPAGSFNEFPIELIVADQAAIQLEARIDPTVLPIPGA